MHNFTQSIADFITLSWIGFEISDCDDLISQEFARSRSLPPNIFNKCGKIKFHFDMNWADLKATLSKQSINVYYLDDDCLNFFSTFWQDVVQTTKQNKGIRINMKIELRLMQYAVRKKALNNMLISQYGRKEMIAANPYLSNKWYALSFPFPHHSIAYADCSQEYAFGISINKICLSLARKINTLFIGHSNPIWNMVILNED